MAMGLALWAVAVAPTAAQGPKASATPFGDVVIDEGLPEGLKALIRDAQGVGVLNLPDTFIPAAGPVPVKGELARIGVKHAKTAVLAMDYEAGFMLGHVVLSAGTPFYATIMSAPAGGAGTYGVQVGWCAPRYSKTLETAGDRGICFFKTPNGQARFNTVTSQQSPFFASSVNMSSPQVGPFPSLSPVDTPLGADLREVYSLQAIRGDAVVISVDVDDGRTRSRIDLSPVKIGPDGTALFSVPGGKIGIRLGADRKTVTVEVVQPIRPAFRYTDIQASPLARGYSMSAQSAERTFDGAQWVSNARPASDRFKDLGLRSPAAARALSSAPPPAAPAQP